MAYTAAFTSPLGPMHLAPPSQMSNFCITSLFRSRTPKASTSSLGQPTKPKKRASKPRKPLEISSPITTSSHSTYQECFDGRSSPSPPPPPYRRAEMGTEEDLEYAERAEEEDEQLAPKERLSIEEMQRRLEQWEAERLQMKRGKVVEQDQRMDAQLKGLGL